MRPRRAVPPTWVVVRELTQRQERQRPDHPRSPGGPGSTGSRALERPGSHAAHCNRIRRGPGRALSGRHRTLSQALLRQLLLVAMTMSRAVAESWVAPWATTTGFSTVFVLPLPTSPSAL